MVRRWFVLCALVAAAATPARVEAQITRIGATANILQIQARGTSVAYDTRNDVYLVVTTFGVLRGLFVSADGVPLGAAFVIQAAPGNFSHFPRVAYSPDANAGSGGFLVTWHESDGAPTSIHARIVAYPSGAVGADHKLTGPESFWEVGAGVAYSTVSREFLVVWRTFPATFGTAHVRGIRVGNTGAPLGAVFNIASSPSHEDNPNVAYNPTVDEFMVVYPAVTDVSRTQYISHLYGRRIKAGTGELLATPTTIATTTAIYITDIAYDSITGLYLVVWYQDPPRAIYGRRLNADGAFAGEITALSSRFAAYDSLSLAYNRTSGTYFAISHDLRGGTNEDGGVEIDTAAVPLSSGTQITAHGGVGNFYPRVAASERRAQWYAVASGSFSHTIGQLFESAARSGAAPLPPPTNNPPPGTTTTQMALSRSSLSFGVLAGPAGRPGTTAQPVTVRFTNGSSAWSVSSSVPWLSVTPATGTRAGTFNVSLVPGRWSVGTDTAALTISAPGAVNSPQSISVTVTTRAAGTNPFGLVETPTNNVTGVSGSIPVTGWALDDLGIKQVTIWRDPVSGEPPTHSNGKVFIGTAVRVDGARPDVDAAYSLPFDNIAGWGFMVLTNMLPNGGTGTFVLHAYAEDIDGNTVLLGSRTVTCDNAGARHPFGAIDTPGQGDTISGVYTNFGWVLTPQPNFLPTDGSTITVYIDGVPVGKPTYNQNRSDIAALFPGRVNSNGAIGFYTFDTTQLTDGVHTIAWSAIDSGGNAVGIGSRYFTVLNGSSAAVSTLTLDRASSPQELAGGAAETRQAAGTGIESGRPAQSIAGLPASDVPVYTRDGYHPSAPMHLVETDDAAVAHVITGETGRVALTLGPPATAEGDGYEGYLVANGVLRALPSGSFLDRVSGDFFWQPGVGFVGSYELKFVRVYEGVRRLISVHVKIP